MPRLCQRPPTVARVLRCVVCAGGRGVPGERARRRRDGPARVGDDLRRRGRGRRATAGPRWTPSGRRCSARLRRGCPVVARGQRAGEATGAPADPRARTPARRRLSARGRRIARRPPIRARGLGAGGRTGGGRGPIVGGVEALVLETREVGRDLSGLQLTIQTTGTISAHGRDPDHSPGCRRA